jgi:hypothetical protein
MKVGSNKKEIFRFIIIILIIIIVGITTTYINNCGIKKNYHLTYAIPYKFIGKSKGFKMTIFINNKLYEEESSFYGKKPILGQKYFIIVNKENIGQSVLLSNCPVPDSLEIPPNGWYKMPFPEYQKEVDAYFEESLNTGIYKLFPKWY